MEKKIKNNKLTLWVMRCFLSTNYKMKKIKKIKIIRYFIVNHYLIIKKRNFFIIKYFLLLEDNNKIIKFLIVLILINIFNILILKIFSGDLLLKIIIKSLIYITTIILVVVMYKIFKNQKYFYKKDFCIIFLIGLNFGLTKNFFLFSILSMFIFVYIINFIYKTEKLNIFFNKHKRLFNFLSYIIILIFSFYNYGLINLFLGENVNASGRKVVTGVGVLSVGYNGDKVIEGLTSTATELIKSGSTLLVEKEKTSRRRYELDSEYKMQELISIQNQNIPVNDSQPKTVRNGAQMALDEKVERNKKVLKHMKK